MRKSIKTIKISTKAQTTNSGKVYVTTKASCGDITRKTTKIISTK